MHHSGGEMLTREAVQKGQAVNENCELYAQFFYDPKLL
jgi:hypothetical protein